MGSREGDILIQLDFPERSGVSHRREASQEGVRVSSEFPQGASPAVSKSLQWQGAGGAGSSSH